MRLLVLDTCLAACQAAVAIDGRVVAALSIPMSRGHQEHLAPMAREALARSRLDFEDLDRIGVTLGPGSFTGLRVGLAFAKGLALALDRPCVGIGTLAALADSGGENTRRAAIIDAGRGAVYLQIFDGLAELTAPDIMPLGTAAARLAEIDGIEFVVGPDASRFAAALAGVSAIDIAAPSPAAIVGLATKAAVVPPQPIYLRAPDARVHAR